MKNGWKKAIEKANATQAEVARLLGVTPAYMSQIVNGLSYLRERDELFAACALLHCKPEAIYSADVLSALYGIGAASQATARPRRQDTRVRISAGIWPAVCAAAERVGMEPAALVNGIVAGEVARLANKD